MDLRPALWPIVAVALLTIVGTAYWRLAAARSHASPTVRTHIEISGEKFDLDNRYTPTHSEGGKKALRLAGFRIRMPS